MQKLRLSRTKERADVKPASQANDASSAGKMAMIDDQAQQQQKKKKQPAIISFFMRFKLRRRLFARRRSRSRERHRESPGSPLRQRSDNEASDNGDDEDEEDNVDGTDGSPGAYDLRPLPPPGRKLCRASAIASLRLNAWTSPYDFAVQLDRILVPGLSVAEFSLALHSRPACWPAQLGRRVPLCIDATPGLVFITAVAASGRCGLFVFDRAGRLAASRLEASTRRRRRTGSSDPSEATRPRRPSMFAVRVNFRGECWVTNPRQLTVDHYTPAPALKLIRSIDVSKFGVPYYLTMHSHHLRSLWVSFPETRYVVKFDWLTLEPQHCLNFGVGQSPCGLHLDERGDKLYVTDIGASRMHVYRAGSMRPAVSSTSATNAALTAAAGPSSTGQRPAAIRLIGNGSQALLLLLSCPTSGDCWIDAYSVSFEDDID